MKKVMDFLKKNDIGYGIVTFNNGLYCADDGGDCPTIKGLRVWFKCDSNPNSYNTIRSFKKFLDSVHTYDVTIKGRKDGCVFYVTSKHNRRRLEAYKKKVDEQERECFENIKRHIEALNSGKLLVGNGNGNR